MENVKFHFSSNSKGRKTTLVKNLVLYFNELNFGKSHHVSANSEIIKLL